MPALPPFTFLVFTRPSRVLRALAQAAAMDDATMAKLKDLASLKDSGILSEEEFALKKTELLGRL